VAIRHTPVTPWPLYPQLQQLLVDSAFPLGVFTCEFSNKDRSGVKVHQASTDCKTRTIKLILQRFSILVGDRDGHDPKVFAPLVTRCPKPIKHAFIRRPKYDETPVDHFRAQFGDVPHEKVLVFIDPTQWNAVNLCYTMKRNVGSDRTHMSWSALQCPQSPSP
jgi:hypothetical protein